MEKVELIFLNDFCCCEKLIAWQNILKLLEGDSLHIAALKTHISKDLITDNKHAYICNINFTNKILHERKN